MPLEDPQLDDRTFEQLLRDLRLRIPRYTKEWTNFNDSDPGMTLAQLFAWLTELMLFRMNQVPLKNYIKFLKLLGQELRPARPAVAHLTFTTTRGAKPGTVPAGSQISAQLDDGGEPLIFETETGLDLVTMPLEVVGIFDGAAFLNVSEANKTPGTKFRPFDWAPDIGNAMYLGFGEAANEGEPGNFPQQIALRVFLPPEATAGQPQQCTGQQQPQVPPVKLVWEYLPRPEDKFWQPLNVFEDESVAFTREGYVKIGGPQDIQSSIEPRLDPKPRFWIRVRLDAQAYPANKIPELDFLRPNTVEAKNLSTVRSEFAGISEGQPGERFQLQRKPVEKPSLEIRTELPNDGGVEEWTRVDDFLASEPDHLHYTLNATAGIIQFGDGKRGRIPDASAEVIATEYRHGGGARGNNAGPGTIKSPQFVLSGVDKVTNERPAVGGSDEQTLEELKFEAPSLLRRRDRAVTPADFTDLAQEIGGVAKAKALPGYHPDHPGVNVPGAITVVVVPDNTEKRPEASGDLIRQICAVLDEKRLLTTEVFVKGPEFQEIRIETRVTAAPYASFDTVTLEIIKELGKLFDPRKGNFGKEMFPTSVFSAILGVKDVVAVLKLNVFVDGRLHDNLDPVKVPLDGLVFGQNHIITVEPESDQ